MYLTSCVHDSTQLYKRAIHISILIFDEYMLRCNLLHANITVLHDNTNNSHVDINNSHVDINNSHVDINNSHVDINNSHAKINTPHGDMRPGCSVTELIYLYVNMITLIIYINLLQSCEYIDVLLHVDIIHRACWRNSSTSSLQGVEINHHSS